MRLRQLVIAARDGEKVAEDLKHVLSLGEPFPDPGVGTFGLENAVFAIGDQFLEVIWPVAETAPAERFLQRNGDGGYMVILQTDDLETLRARADETGIRRVWNSDHEQIAATHFHPADIGGAILSVDTPVPPESWLWGGPDWESRSVPGKFTGAEFISRDAKRLRARWSGFLGVLVEGDAVTLSDADLRMVQGDTDALAQFDIAVPDPAAVLQRAKARGLPVSGTAVTIGGTRLALSALG